jgi:LuxR family transcriptional regulator, maltose regulon positive regulatory protein
MKARIWVVQGRLTKALEWVHEQGLSPDDELSYLREFEHITLTRILIAQYKSDRMDCAIQAAMLLLDRLLQAAEEGSRMGSVIKILVLQALAHLAQGNNKPALAPLERALTLAEPEGYVRIFVDEGESMRLLILDLRLWIENESRDQARKLIGYIDRLLAAFTRPASNPQSETSDLSRSIDNLKSTMVEPLSERELEVLRLLRTDLNGPQIARECMVSLSTVRTHTQNIYAKLGVNSRRAAVRRAEELDLL